MGKQRFEKIMSDSLKFREDFWFIKLQVIPLAHKTSPADFICLSKKFRYLIECKQIDIGKNEKNTWKFDRLTQLYDLLQFDMVNKTNKSFIAILWLNKRLDKSKVFMIPIKEYYNVIKDYKKKSMTLYEFYTWFKEYDTTIFKGGILDLSIMD